MTDLSQNSFESLLLRFKETTMVLVGVLNGTDQKAADDAAAEHQAARAAIYAHVDEIRNEFDEMHALIRKQSDLLTGVVNAIKGEPPELTLWSHHDAPELAAALASRVSREAEPLHCGIGKLTVNLAVVEKRPAVVIRREDHGMPIGSYILEKDPVAVAPDDTVITFPTANQAAAVLDALCNQSAAQWPHASIIVSQANLWGTMVDRFLGWELPQDFSPDGGISFDKRGPDARGYDRGWPIGTNLLTSTQALEMLQYVITGEKHG